MKKMKISLFAFIAIVSISVSFISYSEPGFERYLCSLHHKFPGIQDIGGGIVTSSSRAECVAQLEHAQEMTQHLVEISQKVLTGEITPVQATIHVPEHCATLDPFY